MKNLNKNDIEFLIDCLKKGKEIPDVYKYAIFPTKQKEYELVYEGKMRKEDVIADTEEAKPVPLQVEKIFNNKNTISQKEWQNLLIFGDNLQILKTFYENKDILIKNKIKGKVKLIYIDPPFATKSEFQNRDDAKAYSDKKKGAEFVEYLRKRLIVAKEILADDGSIFVHLDWKKSHYIKLVLDEVFGENNFRNEIIWTYTGPGSPKMRQFNRKHDTIFWYTKTDNWIFNGDKVRMPSDVHQGGFNNEMDEDMSGNYSDKGKIPEDWWYMAVAARTRIDGVDRTGYPTEKPNKLIERIIKATTNEGDIIMDFFAGSGVVPFIAEKLGRKWIACDIGKLSIYTIQNRLLGIEKSKDLNKEDKKYNKPAKPFSVIASGLYDLGKVFALQKDEYISFVKNLFEVEETKIKKISGVAIDGKKREFYVKIFPYWELKNTSIDEKYLQELYKNIGNKIDGRFYIIVPANNVDFISDYHKIGDVRFYFLKVPYQIIKELHKVQFKKLHQPQSKSQINDLDEAIGFHFIRQPEVKSEIKILKDNIVLKIKKFESAYSQDENGEKLANFESLAMLLVDLNYNDDIFSMTNYFFAQDLINYKPKENEDEEQEEEEIKKELVNKKEIIKEFLRKDCGKKIMAIYVDIYGNEFREIFNIK